MSSVKASQGMNPIFLNKKEKFMRKFFTKALMGVAAAGMLATSAEAKTFTAVVSGKLSSATTFGGDQVPVTLSANDVIIIGLGITVEMDQDIIINDASSSVSVLAGGTLQSSGSNYMAMTNGSLTGSGTIDVDSVMLAVQSGITFTGDMTARAMTMSNATINSAIDVTVNEALYVMNGTSTMSAGTLKLNNSGTTNIMIDGGMLDVQAGASADLTTNYNVMYINSSSTAGVELSGSGLRQIDINVGNSNDVTLDADLIVTDNLSLTSGTLVLNNNNLTINSTGSFDATANGMISSSSGSDITILAASSLTGTLMFDGSNNTVDDFTINFGNSSSEVMIGSDVMVSGTLDLQSGRINIGANDIQVMSTGSISGGSANSYVITDKGGSLSLDIAANADETFFVGTDNSFAPAVIKSNGAAYADLSVGVNADVMSQGTFGYNVNDKESVVNTTWFVENSASANVDIDMELWWSSNMEVNSFDRTKAYVSHYVNGSWDATASANAMTQTNGMFSIERTGVKSLSPFAVFDENTSLSVGEVATTNDVQVYPNPATDAINISYNGTATATAEVYNLAGSLVKSANVVNGENTISLNGLNSGIYYIRLAADGATSTHKFVKR